MESVVRRDGIKVIFKVTARGPIVNTNFFKHVVGILHGWTNEE